MPAPRSEQRNVYKGEPARAGVRLQLVSVDDRVQELEFLVDTGNPCAIIIGTERMQALRWRDSITTDSNFGPLEGGWLRIAIPELAFDEKTPGEKAIAWESTFQMQYLHDFLAAIEWWKLEPAHELVRHQPDDVTRRMVLAKVAGSDFAVAYLPDNAAIEVNLSAFSALVAARWFDPVCGRRSPVTGRIPHQGDRRFAPPAKGDWVLVIERPAEGIASPRTQSK